MSNHHRNVITLSNIPPDLHEWTREEAKRRKRLDLPGASITAVHLDSLRAVQVQQSTGKTYLLDGNGPYFSTLECLDALGVPQEDRGRYWYRLDRLPQEYQARIQEVPQAKIVVTDEEVERVGEPV